MSLPFPARLRAVLFDWDGTLVDSADLSFRCYVAVFTRFGVPFDRDAYARTYSPDWYRTYRLLGLDEACWPEADRLWREHYTRHAARTCCPERQAALQRLSARGPARSASSRAASASGWTASTVPWASAALFATLVCGGDTERAQAAPGAAAGRPRAHGDGAGRGGLRRRQPRGHPDGARRRRLRGRHPWRLPEPGLAASVARPSSGPRTSPTRPSGSWSARPVDERRVEAEAGRGLERHHLAGERAVGRVRRDRDGAALAGEPRHRREVQRERGPRARAPSGLSASSRPSALQK